MKKILDQETSRPPQKPPIPPAISFLVDSTVRGPPAPARAEIHNFLQTLQLPSTKINQIPVAHPPSVPKAKKTKMKSHKKSEIDDDLSLLDLYSNGNQSLEEASAQENYSTSQLSSIPTFNDYYSWIIDDLKAEFPRGSESDIRTKAWERFSSTYLKQFINPTEDVQEITTKAKSTTPKNVEIQDPEKKKQTPQEAKMKTFLNFLNDNRLFLNRAYPNQKPVERVEEAAKMFQKYQNENMTGQFLLFLSSFKEMLKKDNPKMTEEEIVQLGKAEWGKLSPDEQDHICDQLRQGK